MNGPTYTVYEIKTQGMKDTVISKQWQKRGKAVNTTTLNACGSSL
jgi:hypothetical protein